jgi:hypothetical protein
VVRDYFTKIKGIVNRVFLIYLVYYFFIIRVISISYIYFFRGVEFFLVSLIYYLVLESISDLLNNSFLTY